MKIKEWKYGYRVSESGDVFKKDSPKQRLAVFERPSGDFRVFMSHNSNQIRKYIHDLVLEVFVGPKPFKNMRAIHIDGDKSNNHFSNLVWASPKEVCLRRFWANVEKTKSCWNFKRTFNSGYGYFYLKRKNVLAHRWIYERMVRKVPKELVLDHLCRNRACVNPDHLEIVSHKENCLRGISMPAQNARKKFCKRGHQFNKENTISSKYRGNPRRQCRVCKIILQRKRRESGETGLLLK